MPKLSPLCLLSSLLCLLLAAVGLASCANPGSGPDGGPYDETPPKVVSMTPSLGGTNEKARKVSIAFDELIKVENAQEKVIVSPPQIEMPEIKTSGKRISVELMDSLKPNTTYTIDFSDAIVDSNEGNPLGNFTYYFSTGEKLDTMEVAGHVLEAGNLEPVKGILVGLHSNLADSAFTRLPFDRVARTDGNGHFSIKGVAPGKYHIYALKDVDGDFKYSLGEMMAFSDEEIKPSSFPDIRHDTLWADTIHIDTIRSVRYTHYIPDDVVLLAFTEKNLSRQLLKTQREPEYFRTFFTAPSAIEPKVRGLNFDADGALVVDRSAGNDTLTYWLRDTALVNRDSLLIAYTYEATNDSTHINFMQTDTLELVPRLPFERRQKLREAELTKWRKGLEKRHKQGDYSQEQPPVDPLRIIIGARGSFAPDQNVRISLPEPAARFDTTGIHLFLKVDSTYHEAPYRIDRSPLSHLEYTLRAEWRPKQEYVLNVDSACITGLSGKVNLPNDISFSIDSEDKYGSLFLLIPEADSTAVVQLMTADNRVERQVRVKNGRADFFYLRPTDYYLRLYNDLNHNLTWDPGCYAEGRQAERVYYYPHKLTVRANWDIEQTWDLNALPITQQKPREIVKQKADAKKTPKNRNAERLRQKGR